MIQNPEATKEDNKFNSIKRDLAKCTMNKIKRQTSNGKMFVGCVTEEGLDSLIYIKRSCKSITENCELNRKMGRRYE